MIGLAVAKLTERFDLLSLSIGEAEEQLEGVSNVTPAPAVSQAQITQQAEAVQKQIQAQVAATVPPAAAPQLPAQSSKTEQDILRELIKQSKIAIDQLRAIENSAFIAGGT